jgi:uncharacterized protein (TIGR00730 family)
MSTDQCPNRINVTLALDHHENARFSMSKRKGSPGPAAGKSLKTATTSSTWTKAFQSHVTFQPAASQSAAVAHGTPQTNSDSFQLAFGGNQFLLREDMRHARLQLEYQKCDLVLNDNEITSTIVVFGSARIKEPKEAERLHQIAEQDLKQGKITMKQFKISKRILASSVYYDAALDFGKIVAQTPKELGVICTGGGPGIMEAACRGAFEDGAETVGLNILLPYEQYPNPYITPQLCFNFHYFSIRKMHLLLRAKALVAFPGGYGTLDELFEALTLIQTGKMTKIPIVLFGTAFWKSLLNFEFLVDEGMIGEDDLKLFKTVETAQEGNLNLMQRGIILLTFTRRNKHVISN